MRISARTMSLDWTLHSREKDEKYLGIRLIRKYFVGLRLNVLRFVIKLEINSNVQFVLTS